MYAELIHTRCGEGIDIRNGLPLKNSGFHVHSCSDKFIANNNLDIPFLTKAIESKQSYSDPSFMYDAYLYYLPEIGEPFLIDFHPIHFDSKNISGNYAHRRDNFINQMFMGEFDDFYPYETFGNSSVWDAKEKGELYYYENPPQKLPERERLDDTIGNICIDDINTFVNDGRREALKQSIAFLINQYDVVPENRKYLLIKEENERNIELWIAAIESAFSPRMASKIPFATRMDQFVVSNKYTVNLNGQYQTQINLQSPTQKIRYKAMIVGVDERDKSNASNAKLMANSPFVILDGKSKKLSEEIRELDAYYDAVTEYDEHHMRFCREFLQMIDCDAPLSIISNFYAAFQIVEKIANDASVQDVAKSLTFINKYKIHRCNYLKKLNEIIKQKLPVYLEEDTVSALLIINWLTKTSEALGESDADVAYSKIVKESFAELFFASPSNDTILGFWQGLRASDYFVEVGEYIISEETTLKYFNYIDHYDYNNWKSFLTYYAGFISEANTIESNSEKVILTQFIKSSVNNTDVDDVSKIISTYMVSANHDSPDFLFEIIKKGDDEYAGYLINVVIRTFPQLMSQPSGLDYIYSRLTENSKTNIFSEVLKYKCKRIVKPLEMEQYIDSLKKNPKYSMIDLAPILFNLDANIVISDNKYRHVGKIIQEHKTSGTKYVHSAHLCALDMIENADIEISKIFNHYEQQDFPSVKDEAYARKLILNLLKSNITKKQWLEIFDNLTKTRFYADILVEEVVNNTTSRNNEDWNILLEIASHTANGNLNAAIADYLLCNSRPEKSIKQLEKFIDSNTAFAYFEKISKVVLSQTKDNNEKSVFGKLFSKKD